MIKSRPSSQRSHLFVRKVTTKNYQKRLKIGKISAIFCGNWGVGGWRSGNVSNSVETMCTGVPSSHSKLLGTVPSGTAPPSFYIPRRCSLCHFDCIDDGLMVFCWLRSVRQSMSIVDRCGFTDTFHSGRRLSSFFLLCFNYRHTCVWLCYLWDFGCSPKLPRLSVIDDGLMVQKELLLSLMPGLFSPIVKERWQRKMYPFSTKRIIQFFSKNQAVFAWSSIVVRFVSEASTHRLQC